MSLLHIQTFEREIQSRLPYAVLEIKGNPTTKKTVALALSLFLMTLLICSSVVALSLNHAIVGFALLGSAPAPLGLYPTYKKLYPTPFERKVDQFLSLKKNSNFVLADLSGFFGYSNDTFDYYVTRARINGEDVIGKISFIERKIAPLVIPQLSKVIN